jgi:flagellar basal body-associated protein FliL
VENPSETATETVESTHQNSPSEEAPSENATDAAPSNAEHAPENHEKTPRAKKSKPTLTPEMTADPVSRKMFLYAKVFAALALVCIGFLTTLYVKKIRANRPHPVEVTVSAPELFKFEKEQLTVVLSNQQELRVAIAFDCNSKAACDFLKEHTEQTDDLLVPILNSIDPLTLEDAQSKKLLRQKIVDQLNTLIPEGKVLEANFTNLSLEGGA